MQTALFITDCSVDTALSLRTWLAQPRHHPLRLRVVYPYDTPAGEPLHKSVCQPARTEAIARLANWTAMLGAVDTTCLHTEVLFATPSVALSSHLLIRDYDYLLLDDWSAVDQLPQNALPGKIRTVVRSLRETAYLPKVSCPPEARQELAVGQEAILGV
ncbi:hypothetical protein J2I47_02575 [Fibrella sp. HMF5335]|uniref:Uncharacterized protein n=1 Tax=Fibrella rubiginis TaxID=2817060 RepID=A0A939K1N1_9BACT|nr:hypothetical protein [Fibrella rubiginis]MBO0935424.1 hypothetical protein [Fibrella rubiginis]